MTAIARILNQEKMVQGGSRYRKRAQEVTRTTSKYNYVIIRPNAPSVTVNLTPKFKSYCTASVVVTARAQWVSGPLP